MKTNTSTVKTYLPLIVVVAFAGAQALAICIGHDQCFVHLFMNTFMGIFLCLLSMFKLFDIAGFVDGFLKYDLIAKRFRPYGYLYPFVELSLGLCFIAGCVPLYTNIITVIIMTISAIGVIKTVSQGLDLRCACLGTVLNVPLSTVSIVENVGMGIMALINIIFLLISFD